MRKISDKFRRDNKITYKLVDSTVYILHTQTNTIHTLNETASFIWNHLDKPTTIGDLARLITETYDTTYSEALKDTNNFINKYISSGYVKYVQK
jgi:hypothetical protein